MGVVNPAGLVSRTHLREGRSQTCADCRCFRADLDPEDGPHQRSLRDVLTDLDGVTDNLDAMAPAASCRPHPNNNEGEHNYERAFHIVI